jgi:hypothetical protein
LGGDHSAAALRILGSKKMPLDDLWILSSDLTTASDLLRLDEIEALVDGILESSVGRALPDWMKQELYALTGPIALEYPDGRTIGESQSGALMGLPTTWPLLCLAVSRWYSRAWLDCRPLLPQQIGVPLKQSDNQWWQAWRPDGQRHNLAHSEAAHAVRCLQKEHGAVLPGSVRRVCRTTNLAWPEWIGRASPSLSPLTAVCGDDLLGFSPKSVCDAFDAKVGAQGGKLSAGKHFRSRRYGLFTEEVFEIKLVRTPDVYDLPVWRSRTRSEYPTLGAFKLPQPRDPDWVIGRARKLPMVALRGLVRPHRLPRTGQEVPWWVALGPACECAVEASGNPLAVRRVVRTIHPDAWTWAREHGFAASVPRVLGGFGLPPKTGAVDRFGSQPRWVARAAAVWLYGTRRRSGDKLPFGPWNSAHRGSSSSQLAQEAVAWKLAHAALCCRRGRVPWNGRGVLFGDLRVPTQLASSMTTEIELLMGWEPQERYKVGPRSVSNGVRKFYKRLLLRKGKRRDGTWEGISRQAPRRRILDRAEALLQSMEWYFDPRKDHDGLRPLGKTAKRRVFSALG